MPAISRSTARSLLIIVVGLAVTVIAVGYFGEGRWLRSGEQITDEQRERWRAHAADLNNRSWASDPQFQLNATVSRWLLERSDHAVSAPIVLQAKLRRSGKKTPTVVLDVEAFVPGRDIDRLIIPVVAGSRTYVIEYVSLPSEDKDSTPFYRNSYYTRSATLAELERLASPPDPVGVRRIVIERFSASGGREEPIPLPLDEPPVSIGVSVTDQRSGVSAPFLVIPLKTVEQAPDPL